VLVLPKEIPSKVFLGDFHGYFASEVLLQTSKSEKSQLFSETFVARECQSHVQHCLNVISG